MNFIKYVIGQFKDMDESLLFGFKTGFKLLVVISIVSLFIAWLLEKETIITYILAFFIGALMIVLVVMYIIYSVEKESE